MQLTARARRVGMGTADRRSGAETVGSSGRIGSTACFGGGAHGVALVVPTRPARLLPLGLLAVLLAVLVPAGCWSGGDDPPTVLVVGDSVTYLSLRDLRAELHDDDLQVVAHVGARTDELLRPARAKADDVRPDVGVFLVGYNDVLQGTTTSAALDSMVALADRIDCSVLLLLPTHGPYPTRAVQRWNDRLRRAAARASDVHVVDTWKKLVDASPPYTFIKHTDGVHPNRQGARAVARVMSDAVAGRC